MSSTSSTVTRREAAVAAALAGTVVVVLGYASGLGVSVEPATTVLSPPQPAAPYSAAPEPTAQPVAAPAMAPPLTAPSAAPTQPTSETPEHTHHPTPTEPHPDPIPDPDPSPDPSPDPTGPGGGPQCSSPLEALPVLGPATVPLTSLLGDVLATTQEALGLAPPTSSSDGLAPLECLLGAALSPTCCGSPRTERDRGDR